MLRGRPRRGVMTECGRTCLGQALSPGAARMFDSNHGEAQDDLATSKICHVSAVRVTLASSTRGTKMGRFAILMLLLLAIYAGSYAAFRQTNQEVWTRDKQTYIIFPSGAVGQALYYVWRPLSHLDSAI